MQILHIQQDTMQYDAILKRYKYDTIRLYVLFIAYTSLILFDREQRSERGPSSVLVVLLLLVATLRIKTVKNVH